MVQVPSQYVSYVRDAANYLGIPYDVVANQIADESSFNPSAQSGAGAQGIAQFEPGTFASYGPRGGSPWNVADAFTAYKNYMHHLLNTFGGNLQHALAGYNAGEGNINAGMGYADKILGEAKVASTTTSGDTLSPATASGNQPGTATISPEELAVQYGFTKDFLNANPELKPIFEKAVGKTWSKDRFKAALMGTQWWKTHSDSEKTYLTLQFTDPTEARQQYTQAQVHAAQVLAQMGVSQTDKNYNSVLGTVTYNIAAKGWNDQQVKYFAVPWVNLLNGRMSGDAETNYSNGLQYAYSMGVKMSDSWYQNQVRGIEAGTNTFADLQAGIRNQAKAQFSQFSKQIDAGQTMQDLASPYISQMGQILEVNPQQLSAFDPTIKKALTYKDPTTGAVGSQPLWQFENTLREDPRWLQTNNARDTMMTTAHGVLQSFGFVS